jgi:Tol biopolymer transport system component
MPLSRTSLRLGAISLTTALLAGAAAAMPPFGPWSAPANLASLPGTGAGISTPAVDGCASLSPDGLSIGFTSNRTGNFEVYVATRSSKSEGFGSPVRLPAPINTSANDSCPTMLHGNRIFFSSDRDDPAYDLYEARREGGAWSVERLGPNINLPGWIEESATVYEDDGHEVMIFSRRRGDGSDGKIYQSVDGGPATLVAGGPNSSASDNRPSITHDGKTIFFDSDRYGTLGGPDLYYATRSSTSEPFGSAVHLEQLSSPGFDARPGISWDGTMLTFSSAREGNPSPAPDIWFSTRSRSNGR